MTHLSQLPLTDGPVRFEGAVGVEKVSDGVIAWRLRPADKRLIPQLLLNVACHPAGVRASFVTDSLNVRIDITTDCDTHEPKVDLCVDGQRVATRALALGRNELLFSELSSGPKRVEIFLPTYGASIVHAIMIDDQSTATTWQDTRRRWVVYGSSITQSRRAVSPSQSWASIVAGTFDWHQTCLGYAGQCLFDPIAVHTMAQLPADVMSVCLGINTYGGGFNPRTWTSQAAGVLYTLREKHPTTPLIVFSPTYSEARESVAGASGLSLQQMRTQLSDLVGILRDRGDNHLAYADGLEVIGNADTSLMVDGLHPGGEGILIMGQRICQIFRRLLPQIGGENLLPAAPLGASPMRHGG